MKAVVHNRYGSSEVLEYKEIDRHGVKRAMSSKIVLPVSNLPMWEMTRGV